jgi:lysine-specific histone demethylase 1
MPPSDYAMQCIAAAESSRLNPYALHEEEYQMVREHISHAQVTTYLNIRNGILRLWMSNPLVMVTREEAIGCAKDSRWFDVANVSYEWLVRSGYINFGCVHFKPSRASQNQKSAPEQTRKRKRVVVIGAGMSGLGCARQLEGLFKQNSRRFRDMGEDVPEVVVLEGRDRVGGRVYSRAFNCKPTIPSPVFENRRANAEMGGMIITGFERGNPLNVLVRAQLALPYHNLRADTTLYNSTGKAVDPARDRMVEKLYNDCLDRVSEYKFKQRPSKLIEGKRDLIDEGKDSSSEGGKTIAQVEESAARQPHALPVSQQNIAPRVELVPVSTDRLTGRVHVEPGTPATLKAAYKARLSGWDLKDKVTSEDDIDLESAVAKPDATLGSVVDDVITQFQNIVNLDAQDFRMLNWHIANLEYSNAINYNQLSLQGWDIDAGYEWEGKHSMIIGGYQTVPQGLSLFPTPLNIRKKSPVTRIKYSPDNSGPATVECEDGSSIEADYVVSTIPLGVLKHRSVEFDPPLPPRKSGAIERLGYGVLNKVILVYKEAFWDEDRDIFGVLRFPPTAGRHSVNQPDYTRNRGRFFQWFNVSNTSGLPCLLALMAGDAGFDTEHTSNDDLVSEATRVLRSVFGAHVPEPEETVITRWASDRFARGSYSSAGPNMQQHDYDIMQEPVGNLFFAGEHTIGTHPATVHGAYMSGLRAASEVITSILGPIDVPVPLVLPRDIASLKRKAAGPGITKAQVYTENMDSHIIAQIGLPPEKPKHQSTSAFIFYSRDPSVVEEARRRCDIGRRPGKGKSSWNDIRNEMAKMWKDADAETRKPFEAEAGRAKVANVKGDKAWEGKLKEWNVRYAELEAQYRADNPFVPDPVEEMAVAAGVGGRRTKAQIRSYAEPDSDEDVEMEDE